jgi:hypothetical protein
MGPMGYEAIGPGRPSPRGVGTMKPCPRYISYGPQVEKLSCCLKKDHREEGFG